MIVIIAAIAAAVLACVGYCLHVVNGALSADGREFRR
jgi:hypothetical protein